MGYFNRSDTEHQILIDMPRLTSPADYGKFDRLDDPDSDSIVNETDPGLVLDSNEDRASPLATIVVSLAPWDTLSSMSPDNNEWHQPRD